MQVRRYPSLASEPPAVPRLVSARLMAAAAQPAEHMEQMEPHPDAADMEQDGAPPAPEEQDAAVEGAEAADAENIQDGDTGVTAKEDAVQGTLNQWLLSFEAPGSHEGQRLERVTSEDRATAQAGQEGSPGLDTESVTWLNRALVDTFRTFGRHVEQHISIANQTAGRALDTATATKSIADEGRAKANAAEAAGIVNDADAIKTQAESDRSAVAALRAEIDAIKESMATKVMLTQVQANLQTNPHSAPQPRQDAGPRQGPGPRKQQWPRHSINKRDRAGTRRIRQGARSAATGTSPARATWDGTRATASCRRGARPS